MAREFRPLEDWLLGEVHRNRETTLKPGDKVVVSERRMSCYGQTSVVQAVFYGRATNHMGVCTVQVAPFRCKHGCLWTRFMPTHLTRYTDDAELTRYRLDAPPPPATKKKTESPAPKKLVFKKRPPPAVMDDEDDYDLDSLLPRRRSRRRSMDD